MTTAILVELTATTCCDCGVVFGIEAGHLRRLQGSGAWFHCPNGHRQHFTETEADRLRKQLEQVERRRGWAESALTAARDQRDATERSLRATKGHLTRTRKRIAAGVCPCCNRSFQNVARHMEGQHPDFAKVATHG